MLSNSALFQKKRKASLRARLDAGEADLIKHERSMSEASCFSSFSVSSESSTGSFSSAISASSRSSSVGPLSCHPPLSFNHSPVVPEDAGDYFSHNAGNQEDQESSPRPFYYNQDPRRRPYIYDQLRQWPLKDWQAIPPGLADINEEQSRVRQGSISLPTSQRRPTQEGISALELFVTRGEWKRRGIVFELDEQGEEEQLQHYEFPG